MMRITIKDILSVLWIVHSSVPKFQCWLAARSNFSEKVRTLTVQYHSLVGRCLNSSPFGGIVGGVQCSFTTSTVGACFIAGAQRLAAARRCAARARCFAAL